MSIALMGFVFGGILMAYVQSAQRAEWSGHSLAAQAFGITQLEQGRAALWTSATNEITNLNLTGWSYVGSPTNSWKGYTWTILDLPYNSTNALWATNYVVITNIPILTSPRLTVWMMKVDTVWTDRGKLFTNTLANYFAPDQ